MEPQELVLKNRNGKSMPATLVLPLGEIKGLAVVLHGVGGWKDQPIVRAVAEAYAQWGYATLRFDESNGVNNPDGDFFHETTTQYTHDLEDVIAFVKQQPWGTQPLTIVGHSMGGLVASWYARTHTSEVSRLVLLAPAVSWKMMWWAWLPLALVDLVRGHRKMLGIDGRDFALHLGWWRDFFHFDGYEYAKDINVPTLIISAEKDHTVAKPGEHRRYTRFFSHAEHSTISWADHDFDGHEEEVADTIKQWLTSS